MCGKCGKANGKSCCGWAGRSNVRQLALLLVLISGCAVEPPPGITPAQQRERYVLTAYDRDGHRVGPAIPFGENLRDGYLIVSDRLSDYRTRVPTNLGLNLLNAGANARLRAERKR